ncbi:urease accessory protein UreD [Methylopila sp. M107]|uniref:urease accessory protein UreD n=1 Tax=Methylopila sp. M107 TaxID=1101190 RepID=UPI0003A279BC|nr:urease accessory protein UreD [Methylopila sp. M107]
MLHREPPPPLTPPRKGEGNGGARRQRAEGRIAVEVVALGGISRVARVAESGSSRLRLPRSEHGLDGVMLNIAGGIACGDRMSVEVSARPGARLTLSTPGAERIYRSDGADAEIFTRLVAEKGASIAWLPQETILFDRARLKRRLDADLAPDATLTAFEAIGFGRQARGETVLAGLIEDRWRVRRDGKLVFAETLRLDGAIHDTLGKRTVANGATSLATLLHVAPDAEAKLEAVREALASHDVEAGVTAWNGMLVARILSVSAERLRDAARAALPTLIGRPLPRVWSC